MRTIEQLRTQLTADELADLETSLKCTLDEMARAMIDGFGNQAHAQAQRQKHRSLEASFSGLIRLTAPLKDLVMAARMGKPIPDRELAYPSKTQLRRALARELGVDERTVRRLESEKGEAGLDSRIFKTRADCAAEERAARREQ